MSSSPMWPIRVLWSLRKVDSAGVSGLRRGEVAGVERERCGERRRRSAREAAGVRGLKGSLNGEDDLSAAEGLVGVVALPVGEEGNLPAVGEENLLPVGEGNLVCGDVGWPVGEAEGLERRLRVARTARSALVCAGLSTAEARRVRAACQLATFASKLTYPAMFAPKS